MTAIILRGDARNLPLTDASVDLIVTSPPYWGLRDYRDGDASLDGQIGAEATPGEYIAALIDCTREWMRVLKPTGSIFVNLGDKYSDRADGGPSSARSGRSDRAQVLPPGRSTTAVAPRKSRLLLPERYRLTCVDLLGLTARAVIIWRKTNGMPEGQAHDRVRTSHEDVVHLVTHPDYFSDLDAVREPHSEHTLRYYGTGTSARQRPVNIAANRNNGTKHRLTTVGESGRQPESVWDIATQPLRVPAPIAHARCCAGGDPACDEGLRHYAAMPPALARRIILGWSPVGGTVLDPFGGTGTTAMTADVLGRTGISVELGADYCRLAQWRTADPRERARALGVAPPPSVPTGQGDLFDGAIA